MRVYWLSYLIISVIPSYTVRAFIIQHIPMLYPSEAYVKNIINNLYAQHVKRIIMLRYKSYSVQLRILTYVNNFMCPPNYTEHLGLIVDVCGNQVLIEYY